MRTVAQIKSAFAALPAEVRVALLSELAAAVEGLKKPGTDAKAKRDESEALNEAAAMYQTESISLGDYITVDATILGGAPVFRGTRVPIDSLFEYLGKGSSLGEFLKNFPSVSHVAASAILIGAQTLTSKEAVLQNSSDKTRAVWLQQMREAYTPEVCEQTLSLNDSLPGDRKT